MTKRKKAAAESAVLCACGNGLVVEADGECMHCRVLDWTPAQLLGVKHLGPAIIGKAMHDAAKSYVVTTNEGIFGPALLGEIPEAYLDQRPEAKAAREKAAQSA